MTSPAYNNPNAGLSTNTGYFPAATPVYGAPVAPTVPTSYGADAFETSGLSDGPILPTKAKTVANAAAKIVPAGTAAAIGAATAIARNSSQAMSGNVAKIVASAGEPILKFSWGLVSGVAEIVGSLLTMNLVGAAKAVGKLFTGGATNTAALAKKLAQPVTLTAAVKGGNKLTASAAVGAGLSAGFKALKSSAIWALPAAAINAFVDYKYRDQTDVKRLGTNFAADVIGYTATGMAGAAVGAAVGSMTIPLVGTVVGAGVGILLGMAHDKFTRPLISDMLRDQFA